MRLGPVSCDQCGKINERLVQASERIAEMEQQVKVARKLVAWLADQCLDGKDIDGGDLQGWLIDSGMLRNIKRSEISDAVRTSAAEFGWSDDDDITVGWHVISDDWREGDEG